MSAPTKRVALITGGSRGIGLGIAKALAAEGWSLAINGMREQSQVEQVLAELQAIGAETIYCRGDVGQSADRQAMVDKVQSHFAALHLLVNNAGITSPGRQDILDATEESYDRVMAVNLKGAFFLTQLVARRMAAQHQQNDNFAGTIVNISSISSEIASIDRGDYCISWAGLGMATKLWAARLAEFGVAVYEIRPGITRTDMTAGVTEKYDRLIAEGLTVEPRWGTPEDIGRTVAVLARGEITYATGNVIYVDGGLSLRRL
ncbi:MAG: 3-ketoacyl-ACP reductase [Planctomycetales bacterium]|nr:3-ketoacyl-ACP reductase [Planctomycetales bacterium]